MSDLLFHPPLGFAAAAILTALAAAAALVLWPTPHASRSLQALLLALRLAAVAILGLLLLGPSRPRVNPGAATAAMPVRVLLDRSLSMAEKDTPTGQSRLAFLQQRYCSGESLGYLRRFPNLRFHSFAAGLEPLTFQQAQGLEPDGRQSNLLTALRALADETASDRSADSTGSTGGVILLLSDGHDNDPAAGGADLQLHAVATGQALARRGWRVLAAPAGQSLGPIRDLRLTAFPDADVLDDGQATEIIAQVSHTGAAGETVRVLLRQNDQVLAEQTVALPSALPHQFRFPITAPPLSPADKAAGRDAVHAFELVLIPAHADRDISNNRSWAIIRVHSKPIRVALFDGQPYWDTTFLRRVLEQDPQVELTSVLALSPNRDAIETSVQASTGTGDVPAATTTVDPKHLTAAMLSDFDVIILGKQCERYFPGEKGQLLTDFVRAGGALLLSRGQPFATADPAGAAALAAFEPILPVHFAQQQLQDLHLQAALAAPVTTGEAAGLLRFDELGSTPNLLTELPGLLAASRITGAKPGAIVLLQQQPAGGPPMPALVYQRAGRGRVLALLSQGLWRWAMLPAVHERYDAVYPLFWRRAIHFLATGSEFLPGADLSLTIDHVSTDAGRSVTARVASRNLDLAPLRLTLTLRDPSGTIRQIPLEKPQQQALIAFAVFTPRHRGLYHLELTATLPDGSTVEQTAPLAVYQRSVEQQDPSPRPELLAALTQSTGGALLTADGPQQLLDYLVAAADSQVPAGAANDSGVSELLPLPWTLGAVAALLLLHWLIRRREGLS